MGVRPARFEFIETASTTQNSSASSYEEEVNEIIEGEHEDIIRCSLKEGLAKIVEMAAMMAKYKRESEELRKSKQEEKLLRKSRAEAGFVTPQENRSRERSPMDDELRLSNQKMPKEVQKKFKNLKITRPKENKDYFSRSASRESHLKAINKLVAQQKKEGSLNRLVTDFKKNVKSRTNSIDDDLLGHIRETEIQRIMNVEKMVKEKKVSVERGEPL
jgi:hypothetical protein